MYRSISEILEERFEEIGITADWDYLRKLDLLPADVQDFVCRWDLRELDSFKEFYDECVDSGVLQFDSYVSDVSTKEFPVSLVLSINKVLTITEVGDMCVYSGLPTDKKSKLLFSFPYIMYPYVVRCNPISCKILYNVTQAMIRKAFDGEVSVIDTRMHIGFSGIRKFMDKVLSVFVLGGVESEFDWYSIVRSNNDYSSMKAYQSIMVTNPDMTSVLASVQIYDDHITVSKVNRGCFNVRESYDKQYVDVDLVTLIITMLEQIGVTYDSKTRGFWQYDDKHKISTAGYNHELASCISDLEGMIHVRLLSEKE